MLTVEMMVFVVALGVTVVAFGASVWTSLSQPHTTKVPDQSEPACE